MSPDTDALDVWSNAQPPGGYVCVECGQPTESDPCREHQPNAWLAGGYDPDPRYVPEPADPPPPGWRQRVRRWVVGR